MILFLVTVTNKVNCNLASVILIAISLLPKLYFYTGIGSNMVYYMRYLKVNSNKDCLSIYSHHLYSLYIGVACLTILLKFELYNVPSFESMVLVCKIRAF